ncbi:hypothetical protein [Burkholderia pseudomultivorans]|uniref:hypothetical protein n=1 Tax=Burkholderia pseudomultivorans TaxID=1207504 RepID=UPI0012D9F73F|nr:hypothetical protein [Burkholderia pseudomultivorans]
MESVVSRFVAVIAIGILGYTGCVLIDWKNLTSSEWAAWVQAVGSVVAILIAIWLPARARRDDARDAADSDLQRLQLLAQQGFQFVQNLRSQMKNRPDIRPIFDDAAFEHIRRGLADLPTHRLSPENMARAAKVSDLLGELWEWMAARKSHAGPLDWQEDAEPFQRISVAIMRQKKAIENDMKNRGLRTPEWMAL